MKPKDRTVHVPFVRISLIALLAGLIIVFLVLAWGMMLPAILQSLGLLLVGWAPATLRFAGAFSLGGTTAVLVVCGLAIALALAHSLATWMVRERSTLTAKIYSWPFRRTCLVLSGLGAVALATMAVTATVHQLAWAATSDDEWLTDRGLRVARASVFVSSLRHAAIEAEGEIELAVATLEKLRRQHTGLRPDHYRVSFISGRDGKLSGIVMSQQPLAPDDPYATWVVDGRDFTLDRIKREELQAAVSRLSDRTTP